MTTPDDFEDVIAAELPDELVEELIRGAFEPELPDELVAVGRVLRAAHGPIPGEDREREQDVLDAMLDAMKVVPITAARRVQPARRGRRRVLIAVTAAASVLGVGGVAAAAGSLPTPIQSFVHDTLDSVGVSIPEPSDDLSPTTTLDRSGTDDDAPEPAGSAPVTAGNEDGKGKSDEAPGRTGDTPGQSGESPGKSEDAPGHTGDNPGQSGSAPGESGDTPGHSEDPSNPSATAPGQTGEKPDKANDAPGQQNR